MKVKTLEQTVAVERAAEALLNDLAFAAPEMWSIHVLRRMQQAVENHNAAPSFNADATGEWRDHLPSGYTDISGYGQVSCSCGWTSDSNELDWEQHIDAGAPPATDPSREDAR